MPHLPDERTQQQQELDMPPSREEILPGLDDLFNILTVDEAINTPSPAFRDTIAAHNNLAFMSVTGIPGFTVEDARAELRGAMMSALRQDGLGPGPGISLENLRNARLAEGYTYPPPRQPLSPPPLPTTFENIQVAMATYVLRVIHTADNSILHRVSEAQLTRFSATYTYYLEQQMRHKRRAIRKCLRLLEQADNIYWVLQRYPSENSLSRLREWRSCLSSIVSLRRLTVIQQLEMADLLPNIGYSERVLKAINARIRFVQVARLMSHRRIQGTLNNIIDSIGLYPIQVWCGEVFAEHASTNELVEAVGTMHAKR